MQNSLLMTLFSVLCNIYLFEYYFENDHFGDIVAKQHNSVDIKFAEWFINFSTCEGFDLVCMLNSICI